MQDLVKALTQLVTRPGFKGKRPAKPRDVRVDLTQAPAPVKALAEALSTRYYNVDLGEFSMFDNDDDGSVESLASVIEMACKEGEIDMKEVLATGAADGSAFDPAQSLLLCSDGGGMSQLGVTWSGDEVGFVVVESDDPTEYNLLTHFTSPAELLQFLDKKNGEQDEPLGDVNALRRAAGLAPVKAKKPPQPPKRAGLRTHKGKAPAHPHSLAQAHFKDRRLVLQAGPSPAGRHVLVRRFRAGKPPALNTVAVVGPKGTERTIEWPAPREAYGVCLVPGKERALLCAGVPGPLVELDLESGSERELLPAVRWSCGFVDEQHLAVLADGEVRVYRYDDGELGEPVAAVANDGFNIFVGHGRVFCKTRDMSVVSFRVLAWDGEKLSEEGVVPADSKLFALDAAAEHDGQRLVASIDTKGDAKWMTYG